MDPTLDRTRIECNITSNSKNWIESRITNIRWESLVPEEDRYLCELVLRAFLSWWVDCLEGGLGGQRHHKRTQLIHCWESQGMGWGLHEGSARTWHDTIQGSPPDNVLPLTRAVSEWSTGQESKKVAMESDCTTPRQQRFRRNPGQLSYEPCLFCLLLLNRSTHRSLTEYIISFGWHKHLFTVRERVQWLWRTFEMPW